MGERQRCAGRGDGDRKDVWREVCAEIEKVEGSGEGSCGIGGKVRDVVGKVSVGRRFFVFLMAEELQRIENRSILAVSIKLTQKWENTMTIA